MASKDQGPSQSLSARGLKKFRKEKNGVHFSEENVCYRCVKVSINKKLNHIKGEIQAFVGFFRTLIFLFRGMLGFVCLVWFVF